MALPAHPFGTCALSYNPTIDLLYEKQQPAIVPQSISLTGIENNCLSEYPVAIEAFAFLQIFQRR
jgi:hypothetical protein|tara:strand:- start:298 stop:492 length:195 start_codon:yes stop_codon:yes gene_type:complete